MAHSPTLFSQLQIEGIDPQQDQTPSGDIIEPFDPKKISIVTEPKTIDNLVQRIRHGEVDLNTDFQRKGNLWTEIQQSRLIESLMLRFPLPAFYFDAENDDNWLVVDGLQRLWTFKNFIVDQTLVLQGLDILKEYNGKNISYNRLDRKLQRRISETQVTTYIIQPGTPKPVKYNVFRRINTGGLVLTPMEIRHALNQGIASEFLAKVAEKLGRNLIPKAQRMEDRELLLRPIAFDFFSSEDYEKPFSSFLDRAMERLAEQSEEQLDRLEHRLEAALSFAQELFGEHAFSRSIVGGSNRRYKINAALFETWVSIGMKLDRKQRQEILSRKEDLLPAFRNLLQDDKFSSSVSAATADRNSVLVRFSRIQELVEKHYS
ncbi:MAG: DUF262 domain-containing protein [Bacteroidota bacterium]